MKQNNGDWQSTFYSLHNNKVGPLLVPEFWPRIRYLSCQNCILSMSRIENSVAKQRLVQGMGVSSLHTN